MVFVACGLNYKTAPLALREQVALPEATRDAMLDRLMSLPLVNEATVLSTCNRTEIYCDTDAPEAIIPWLATHYQLQPEQVMPHAYHHQEAQGIKHVLRVASGLDSMMLGEPQILGQMKQAYQDACRAGAVKGSLRSMFQYIFHASKRIRSRSGIGHNPVSIASAAVQLIGEVLPDYTALKVFLIGSGDTATLVAKYLQKHGVTQFMVASRSYENASALAVQYAGKALTITDIPAYLAEADIVISATACPLPFINASLVTHALQQRQNRQMFFFDLAVPRDIEVDVGTIPQVHLYNIDDLKRMSDKGMDERRTAAIEAEAMVERELERYIRWHRSLQAKDIICSYREQMQDLAQLELQRALQKLSAGNCQQTVLNEFTERLVNKLTHAPTIGLRRVAQDNRTELLDLAHYLFNHTADVTPL